VTISSHDPPAPPTGRAPEDGSEGPSFRLLASQNQEKGRALPFAIAAIGHAIVITLVILFAPQSVRLLTDVLDFSPILLIDDNPPPIEHSEPQTTAAVPVPPVEPDRDERTRTAPRGAAPGVNEAPVTPITAPTEVPRTIPPAVPGAGVAEGGGGVADRFRGVPSNPLLFAPATGEAPAAVGPEAARIRLADRVREINDSIAAEKLAAAKATDWTFTDEEGKRWGISPGKLHLGDVTIPLGQSSFVPPPGRRDEFNALVRNWNEIEQQAGRAVVTDNIKDRVKAIRERKDKERVARKKPIT